MRLIWDGPEPRRLYVDEVSRGFFIFVDVDNENGGIMLGLVDRKGKNLFKAGSHYDSPNGTIPGKIEAKKECEKCRGTGQITEWINDDQA